MRLHGFYRSSTSYRLRIALNIKGLEYESIAVHLGKGEQKSAAFTSRNPFGSVPMLEADGRDRAQSMALLEWLDEAYPDPAFLPEDIEARYTAREVTYAIATELHAPLNLQILNYLRKAFGLGDDGVNTWYRHWLARTLDPLEIRLAQLATGDFLFATPGLFEIVLLPQVYNARRFGFDFGRHPHITRIEKACLALDSFHRAYPDNQPESPDFPHSQESKPL